MKRGGAKIELHQDVEFFVQEITKKKKITERGEKEEKSLFMDRKSGIYE